MLLLHIHPEGGTFVQSLVGASEKGAEEGNVTIGHVLGGGVLAGVSGKGREVHVEWEGLAESFGGAGGEREILEIPEFEL